MKKEIRDLQSGDYWSPDESCLLRIKKTDDGVSLEVLDKDSDIYYAFTVENGQTKKFEVGNPNLP
ncbi:MAG: hypothetical protein ACXW1A_05660 [Nitrososphaeraceae archaeon]